jgi:hypothetical protein
MFHLAKQIAQKVSNAPQRYEELMGTLSGILESLSEPVDGEIRDASGRQRGRPRRTGNSPSAPAQTPCPLCGCAHAIQKCPMYDAFLAEKTRYVGVMRGKIHCKLCGYGGHRKNTCPVLAAFRRTMAEQGHTLRRRRVAS